MENETSNAIQRWADDYFNKWFEEVKKAIITNHQEQKNKIKEKRVK